MHSGKTDVQFQEYLLDFSLKIQGILIISVSLRGQSFKKYSTQYIALDLYIALTNIYIC